MSKVIAVAGGSGGLGRAIVDVLKGDNRYKTVILGRKTNLDLEKEIGVPILEAEYSDPDALIQLLEKHKIDTIISTFGFMNFDPTPEFNLITAAEKSSVTNRIIPSIWSGYEFKPEHRESSPIAALKLSLLERMSKTSLEWTAIYPGLFLDYYTPDIKTHINRAALILDVDGNAAGIPGSGTYPVHFTHTTDIAKYTVAVLGLKKWDTKYFIAGETKSWKELVAIVEKVKGVKLNVAFDSIEKLERGEVTELPGHTKMYEAFGGAASKPLLQSMMARSGIWMNEGLGQFKGAAFLNEMFPEIKAMRLGNGVTGS